MFHANLQAAALVEHKTADLRFAVTGLKHNHTCGKSPQKAQLNANCYSVYYHRLLLGLRKHPYLAHREKTARNCKEAKKKNLEAKTANCSGFMLNRQGTEQEVVQSMLETTVLY